MQARSFAPNTQSNAAAINDAGQITGAAWKTNCCSINGNGAFFYENGNVTMINGTRYELSYGLAINNSGVIAGYSGGSSRMDTIISGFTYDGTVTNLPLVMFQSAVTGINDAGQVVGYMDNQGSGPSQVGTLVEDGVWLDLNSLVLGLGSTRFTRAVDINNIGQIIVIGTDKHSYLLSLAPAVPLPASAWLLGSSLLGLTGLASRRKKTRITI